MTVEMIFCEPCFSENHQIQATRFCKTCDDPEPLCDSCAQYHTEQKLSRHHDLSGDIREFQKRYKRCKKKCLAFFHLLGINCTNIVVKYFLY